MKNIFKKLTALMLLAQSFVGLSGVVNAQENYQVKFNFIIELDGVNNPQDHPSYNIYDQNDQSDPREPVFSVPDAAILGESYIELAPGDYTLRLGDGGQFIRDEKAIDIKNIELKSIDESGQTQTQAVGNIGSMRDLADGNRVYEFDFSLGGELPTTNKYEYTVRLSDNPNGELAIEPGEVTFPQVNFSVKDSAQNPVQDVEISVQGSELKTLTDENGLAELGQLEAGDYTVTAQKGQYSQEYTATIDPAGGDTITVNLSDFNPPVEENLVTLVVNYNGQPLANHMVRFAGQDGVTDADGHVVFNLFDNGEYEYEVFDAESLYTDDSRKGTVTVTDEARFFQIDLVEAQTEETSESQQGESSLLDPASNTSSTPEENPSDPENQGAKLTVSFVDELGNGVPGAVINFNDQNYASDQAGKIYIENLMPATYSYEVLTLPDNLELNNQEKTGEIVVDLSGQDVNVNITLKEKEPSPTLVSIIAQTAEGKGVAGLKVDLSGYELETNADGKSDQVELTPGDHQLKVTQVPAGYELVADFESVTLEEVPTQTITYELKEKQKQSVEIIFQDQFNEPLKGVNVEISGNTVTTDSAGKITIKSISPGEYAYKVTGLPEAFAGDRQGNFTVKEGETETTVTLERNVTPGQATITVKDQDGNFVPGAKIKFGGLSGETDVNGQVHFLDLQPGNYDYTVVAPDGYKAYSGEEKRAVITENIDFEDEFILEKTPQLGTVKFQIKIDGKPIKDAEIEFNGQRYFSDQDGFVTVSDVPAGNQKYKLIKAPGFNDLSYNQGEVNVEADKVSEVVINAEKTVTNGDVGEANTKFVDATTGVEVWVNATDAKNVVKVSVNKSVNPDDLANSPLKDQEVDVFDVSVVDKENKVVELTGPALVKLPTRSVNGQIKLYSVNGSEVTEQSFTLNNEKANFSSKKLGRFALSYGQRAKTEKDVKVSKSTNVEKKDNRDLPGTGESRLSTGQITALVAAVLIGLALVFTGRKKK